MTAGAVAPAPTEEALPPARTPRRKPWVAGLLSVLVPGLGQLYAGRSRRAAAFYLVNAVTVVVALVLAVKLPHLTLLAPLLLVVLVRFVWIPGDALAGAMKQPAPKRGWLGTWYFLLACLAFDLALLPFVLLPHVLLPVLTTCAQTFLLPSASMENTLVAGDYILVDRTAYTLSDPFTGRVWVRFGDPLRGDVIAFRFPLDPSQSYVKRVIGLPGETVEMRNGVVSIDGSPLTEPYVKPTAPLRAADDAVFAEWLGSLPPLTVPPGQLFVLGDNRENSRDSRSYGPILAEHVLGRVSRVYWSRGLSRDSSGPVHWGPVRWGRVGRAVQ